MQDGCKPRLFFNYSLRSPRAHCFNQGRVILFGLIRIIHGKLPQRPVKGVAFAQIAADGRGIPGLGMRASQSPAADPRRSASAARKLLPR